MIKVQLKKLSSQARMPQRMTEHAAGYDLYSANPVPIIIQPGCLQLIPTGIAISLPAGYEAQIRPRSGLTVKYQIGVLNSPGTIDADYRGEIKVILFNFGTAPFTVEPQSRIAQMVIAAHEVATFELCETLEETNRGDGGFGHTKH
ncbi:MAG: dUTP diphosphatase [Candidatus Cloacimonetes bacterium]|nr:dUTP diphosphatase [Candidatus Cloacimonadota bacterium]